MALYSLLPDELKFWYNSSGNNDTTQILNFVNVSGNIHGITVKTQPLLNEFFEYQIRNYLNVYAPPVLLVVGTLGNILSLVVLRSRSMVGVSSYYYLASLAVTDTVVLYTGLLRIWLMGLTGNDYIAKANWICKLSVLSGYTASDLSVWLIIAVTVERYIVVCMPFRANSMCNVSRAKRIVTLLFGVVLAINCHFLWTVEVKENESGPHCTADERFVGIVEVVWPWVDAIIYSFLPFIIIVILNIFIGREVMSAQSKRLMMASKDYNASVSLSFRHSSVEQRRQHHTGEGTRLTIMLLTVSFTFLLLTLPVNAQLIFTYYWNSRHVGTRLTSEENLETYKRLARLYLIKAITDLLMYTNHSINFFLYCATGHKFRRQIINLFQRCMCIRSCTAFGFSFFKRSTRPLQGSGLGTNSDITTLYGCRHRASSSCVSLEMEDCAPRLDCNHSGRPDDVSKILKGKGTLQRKFTAL